MTIDFGTTSTFTNRRIVRKSQGAGDASLRINGFSHDGGTFDIEQEILGMGALR